MGVSGKAVPVSLGKDTGTLVQRATGGDGGAIEALLRRYLPGLEAWLRGHAGPRILNRESSSDLSQSVCREVLEDLSQGQFEYRGEREFKQWLYQAAALKIKNRARFYAAERRNADKELTPRSSVDATEQFFQTLCTPSRDASAREELGKLKAGFDQLPERMRTIITRARIEGRSHREIAEEFDISEQNSRMLLSRALARLATLARRRS